MVLLVDEDAEEDDDDDDDDGSWTLSPPTEKKGDMCTMLIFWRQIIHPHNSTLV